MYLSNSWSLYFNIHEITIIEFMWWENQAWSCLQSRLNETKNLVSIEYQMLDKKKNILPIQTFFVRLRNILSSLYSILELFMLL